MVRSLAGLACALWWGLASAEILLSVLLPEGILRLASLAFSARAGLLAGELLGLFALVALAFLPAMTGTALAVRLPEAGWQRRLIRVAELAAVAGVVALLALSWGSYWSIGNFLGVETFLFLADSGDQVALHALAMRPLGFLILIGAIGLVPVVWTAVIRRRWAKVEDSTIRRLPVATAGAVLLALLGSAVATSISPGEKDALRAAWAERTGPVAYLEADLRRLRAPPQVAEPTAIQTTLDRRPRLSLESWAGRVDSDRVRPLNVLLVLVESLRPDEIMAFSGRREVMPSLEKLARRSRTYPRTWTQASHSNYADLAALTGQYPLRDRTMVLYDADSPWPRVLLYDLLAEVGWRTAIFSSQNETWGRMDQWLDTGRLDVFFHSETFDGPTYVTPGDAGFLKFVTDRKLAGKVDDRHTVSAAIDWIRQDPQRPFFVYMNLQSSHVPYIRPPDFAPRFGPEKVDFPVAYGKFPRDKIDVVRDLYSDSLAYVDHQLGRLFAALEELGLAESTLIVVTGDTGQAFYEHDTASHGKNLFEEVTRVPLIVHAPHLEPGIDSRPVQHLDLAPTVLDLLGLPPHPAFQGISLLGPPDPDRSLHLVCQTPMTTQYAIVRRGWKLILDVRHQRTELYNLESDPGETQDLSDQRPAVHRELQDRLLAWTLLQIRYHDDPEWYAREYPPVILDSPAP